ncbi:hypothetical protein BC833DRAFT_131093 [Globomyces pollinis-pini]|nr:hypothetical protein BC833DRAFT_131093 [Globomyces pollinis-pini]
MSTPESMIEKLKTALNLVDVVKKENEVYKENFEKLSTNLKSIQDKNEKLIKEMTVNTNEKNQLEKDLEDYKDKSKKRLQEKDKEIHELLTNPPPLKEIELLKIQMKQDIEHSQKSKFDLIDRECSKFRNLYYKVRREMEATIIDSDSKVNELNRTMEIDQRHHQEELSNLKAQIVLLQQTAGTDNVVLWKDETSDIERLRITQREKQELELRVKSLLNELDQVRGEKEDLRILFEQEERNHKRQLADYISTSKSLHSEKDSLQSKVLFIN